MISLHSGYSRIGYKKDPSDTFIREGGYLYTVGEDGYVWAYPMKHNKTGKKKRVGTKKYKKELIHISGAGSEYDEEIDDIKRNTKSKKLLKENKKPTKK